MVAGVFAMSMAFKDYCLDFPSWANGSSGPVFHLLPPSIECIYGGVDRTEVTRDSGELVGLALFWLAGTATCLYLTFLIWRRSSPANAFANRRRPQDITR
jgi:hypothetical protein